MSIYLPLTSLMVQDINIKNNFTAFVDKMAVCNIFKVNFFHFKYSNKIR
jgi:hypothetical protein